jgi:hypothetical protein
MNTDPRRGLPSATERRRTTVRWSEDAETQPVQGESGTPADSKAMQSVSSTERSGKQRRPHT